MSKDWYCPTCNDYVSWESVTFEEVHELCGTFLGDDKQKTLNQVRAWIKDPFSDVDLTDRERKVITLACRDVSAITIAGRLGVGRQTVYSIIWDALAKINETRNSELNLESLGEGVFRQLERIME